MSAALTTGYDTHATEFLREFEYMRTHLEKYRDEKGGDNMSPDAQRAYDSRKRRMKILANYYDRTEETIADLQAEIAELHNRLRKLAQVEQDLREAKGETDNRFQTHVPYRTWLAMMNIVGCSQPVQLAALLNVREGKRNASLNNARVLLPNLFFGIPKPN